MDEALPSASDWSGRGHDSGVEYKVDSILGRYGQGIQLDPGREGLEVGRYPGLAILNHPDLHVGNTMTFEIWISPLADGPYSIFGDRVAIDAGARVGTIAVEVGDDNRLRFFSNSGCGQMELVEAVQTEGAPLESRVWTHVAYVWDGPVLRLYLDAELIQEYPFDYEPCALETPFTIGNSSLPDLFYGRLDELKLSDWAKSAQDIRASMDQDSTDLLETCWDRVVFGLEACDSSLCCDPVTCEVRQDGAPCGGDGHCEGGACLIEGGRVDDDVEYLYDFRGGSGDVIEDSLGNGPDLLVEDDGAIKWDADGLVVASPTLIQSVEGPTRVHNECTQSSGLSVEAWITPSNISQDGPARIVSYSESLVSQNFLLAQDGAKVMGGVRVATGSMMGDPDLRPYANAVATRPMHLVMVHRDNGDRLLYVDGRRQYFNSAVQDFRNWAPNVPLKLAGEVTVGGAPAAHWLGTYHLVSIYCRGLSQTEVARNFAAGF